jgi:16S rRNA (cytidine1402-2'-O)-methyltransferase
VVSATKGTLYVVATPIGNLQDLSPRAQSVLKSVDLIMAEDTRHSRHLLSHFDIHIPLQSLHEHNEKQTVEGLMQIIYQGKNVALISDAGTPLISDPGRYLLETAHAEHLTVVPIPGASALITALSVAGLEANRFIFEGFLPTKSAARKQRLQELATDLRTLVFYEAPHRIVECLYDMVQVFGVKRQAIISKELTKLFETIHRDTLENVYHWLINNTDYQKGEFVIVIQGNPPSEDTKELLEGKRILHILLKELSLKQAAKLASEITGVSKNILYDWGLEAKKIDPEN